MVAFQINSILPDLIERFVMQFTNRSTALKVNPQKIIPINHSADNMDQNLIFKDEDKSK